MAAQEPPRRHPLTQEERALATALDEDIKRLLSFGVANLASPLTLATVTDDLAIQLEAMGHEVRRGGFLAEEAALMNLEVVVPGRERGRQNIVIGAHFDTQDAATAAYDNASGAALLLSVARWIRERRPTRTVRLVWFSNSANSDTRDEHTGSYVYAKNARIQGQEIVLMLSLDSLGHHDRQRRLRVLASVSAQAQTTQVLRALASTEFFHPTPTYFDDPRDSSVSAHVPFVKFGYPALLLTDAVNPHPAVDAGTLARIAALLPRTLEALAGPFAAAERADAPETSP